MLWINKKAQGIPEYAMLIFLVGVAIAGFLVYFTNAYQGKMKAAGDFFGEGDQYNPETTEIIIEE